MKSHVLGSFEQLILLAILRLGSNAYGVPILEEIARTTGKQTSRAAVYIALRRLEKRGFVTSRLAEPTAERGGRAKRYFRLKPLAVRALSEHRAALLEMWDGLEPILDRG